MSKRHEIRGRIYGNLLVLRFVKNQNSHALWKCKCLNCRKAVFVTYSNLVSGNTKSCASCGQRALSYKQDKEVAKLYSRDGLSLSKIAGIYGVSRWAIAGSLKRTSTTRRQPGR